MIYKSNYGGIRNMTTDDIPAVLNLIRPFVERDILLPRTEESLATLYEDYIVYELDGGIRACAALHTYANGQAEIAAVAVDESFSHLGIGPNLIHYLLGRARNLQCKSVFIMTTQTADWFESLGFKSDVIETLPEERKKLLKRKLDDLKYRCHMIKSYYKDPILCTCGEIMKPDGQYNPFEGGKKNDRRYRNKSIRSMGKLERGRNIGVPRI